MKRSKPLQRRKGLRRVSKKRQAVNVQRREFVAEQLAKRPMCEAGPVIAKFTGSYARFNSGWETWSQCDIGSSELHEPGTRARFPGSDTILEAKNSVATCRCCHEWIHDHPADAESIGLLKSSRGL